MNHMLKLQESLTNIRDALKDWQCSTRLERSKLTHMIEHTQLLALVVLMFIAKAFESAIPAPLDLGIWIAFGMTAMYCIARRFTRKAYRNDV